MAKSLYEYRQEEQKKAEAERRKNALLNYVPQTFASPVKKEGAQASSGFNFGDYIATTMQYGSSMGPVGLLAGLTKPLWEDNVSDTFNEGLEKHVDATTFLRRKAAEGMFKSVEGLVDFGVQITPLALIGSAVNKNVRDGLQDFVERDFVGEWYDRDAYAHREDGALKDDGTVAQIAQGAGGMLPAVLVGLATGGGSLAAQGLSLMTTAAGAAGNATEEAYNDGAGYYGGIAYGAAVGGLEAATEKLVGGGLGKVFGGGWLDNVIPIGDWAKTGVGRYVANAAGEGFEEMVSEAASPLAKTIYKGKDALEEYKDIELYKNIGKAGLMGAAISGIYGGAFDAMGGGVKQGDIQNVISDMESIREQSDKLKVKNNFTVEYGKKADSQTLGDLRIIEKTLKGVDENKRADLINKNGLSGLFETDGSLKADYAEALSKESEFDRRYFDEEYRAHESVIKSDLAELNSELEDRFGENAKKVNVYSGELTQKGKAAYTKLQRAQKIFNELSGRHNGIIVTDESPNFNGKLVGDSRIYISADTLESGAWAGTLVHENMHFAEGTEEYNRLVALLEADTELEAKAVEAVMNKSGYGFDKATLDIIGKRISAGENVEQGARLAYELYRSEINAHMGEAMLGTEAFINRVVRTDAPLAEKIIGKILDLKEAFGRIGDTEAQAQHKRLAEAERLYLKAAEAAGYKYQAGKQVSVDEEDEDEGLDIEADSLYNNDDPFSLKEDTTAQDFEAIKRKMREVVDRFGLAEDEAWAVLKYKTAEAYKINAKLRDGVTPLNAIQEKIVRLLDSALEKLPKHKGKVYRTVSFDDLFDSETEYNTFLEEHSEGNFVAYNAYTSTSAKADGHPVPDGTKYGATLEIECENGRDIDGFGNNFENEVLYPRGFSFVVTEVNTDSNGRPYIKVKEIGENVRYQRNSEERSNVLQQMRAESSVYGDLQEVSEQNTLRSGNTENSVQGVRTEKGQIVATSKFSLKENSSDAKNATSYTKAEAVEMVDGIMESLLSFEWGYGELKNRASVIKQAHAMLNGAEAGKRHGEALKFADYLIEHVVLSDRVDPDMLAPYADKIEMLKPYLHKLNLDSIRGEINYRYDKRNRPYLRWAKRNGERGIGVDVMAMDLEEQGYIFSSRNPADMFFEIDDDYREAVEALKKNAKTAVRETFTADELNQLRNDIAKDIMASFDDRDFSLSKLKQISESRTREAERLREANAQLRKEAWRQSKVAERAIAEKNEAKEKAEKERERRIFSEEYNKHASAVVGLVERIGEWKKGVFESAADANGDVFKGIIGSLTSIKHGKKLIPVKTRTAMKKLADWYGAADIYPIVQELKDAEIWSAEAHAAMMAIGDPKFIETQKPLSVAELKNVELVIRHLKHITETYHRVFRNGKYIDARELATEYLKIIDENTKVSVGRVAKLIDSKYYEYFGDAEALMKWHDKYNKDGFFTATFSELREGALKMAIAQMEMRTELDAWLDNNPSFLKKLNNTTIEVEGIEMTRAEALSLYMTARREHAEGGLAVGGFEVKDAKSGEKIGVDGLVEKEYLEAGEYDLEKLQGVLGKFQRDLYSKFTESEKTYLGFVEKILNEDCKQRKERTDNIRLGYSNTLEGFYYPIRRGHVATKVGDDTLGAELGRIRNLSFNQDTVIGSKGKLFIEPINNVVDRHIAGIAMYENISIAIDNFNRLFNVDISGNKNNPMTIAKAMEKKGGWAEGGKYIDKLIKDIEGINTADKYEAKALAFIRSGFAKFQLGANPKTWVTQLSSLFAASSMLDPKYLTKAMGNIKTSSEKFSAELDEYSALAKLRNSENTSALAQGVMDKIGRFSDVLMKPIGMTDRFVIKKLWYACQLQVEAEQKIKLGTVENKTEAAKLLEKVIFETQQNSLLTERSAAMRSNSELIKGFTMFSSDAMKLTARIIDAYGRVCVVSDKLKRAEDDAKKALEAERKDAIKEMKRATGAALSTAMFMSIIALAFSYLYGKKDDDETLGEMAKKFGADFAGNLLGGLPLIRDLYSLLSDGYEIDHYALSAVNDLVSGVNNLFSLTGSLLSGKQITSQEVASKTKAALFGVGQIFGIPFRNMYNVGRGLTGLGGWLTGNGKAFGYSWDSLFYDKNYQNDLYKAIEAGDDKLAARIASLMVGESFDGVDKAVAKELQELAKNGHVVLPRAVGDSITYDGEEYAFTLRQRTRFEDIYGTADEVLADLVKLKQYKDADDEVKAKAVKYVYDVYYNLAIDDMLGVDSSEKNVLFAEAIDIEKLAIIVAQARALAADTDKNGNVINGSKKRKVIQYIESLSLSAAQKYMIFGYLGYSNTGGEEKVKAYINRLKLSKNEKNALLKYSGYAA